MGGRGLDWSLSGMGQGRAHDLFGWDRGELMIYSDGTGASSWSIRMGQGRAHDLFGWDRGELMIYSDGAGASSWSLRNRMGGRGLDWSLSGMGQGRAHDYSESMKCWGNVGCPRITGARCWWRSWLRHFATSQKVAGSIPDGVTGTFHWHNPSGRTMALGLTRPLTEMSTRNISWG